MKIICVAVCDDCGKNIVTDPENVSIFVVDGQLSGVSICPKCKIPIIIPLTKEDARTIAHKGVKIFSWNTLTEISAENIQ